MPAPTPNWNLVKVKGKFVNSDGTPGEGTVTFTPTPVRFKDAAALTIVLGRPIVGTLDSAGAFEVFLPATNDFDILPTGFTYTVAESVGEGSLTYNMIVPLEFAATGIDIANLTDVPSEPGTYTPMPLGDHLVIAELYIHGGSAGALWMNKYCRLFNPTNGTINLNGKSLQYRTASSSVAATDLAQLAGTIAPRQNYLLKLASNGAIGAALTDVAVDAIGINPAAAGGTLYVADSKIGVLPSDPLVIDRIGYGTSNAPETAPASVSSATTAMKRSSSGADTGNNAVDFSVGVPTPNGPV